jgi:hypothetical protein
MTTFIFPPLVDQQTWLNKNLKSYVNLSDYYFVNCQLLPQLSLNAFKDLLSSTVKQSNNKTIVLACADTLFPLGPPPFLYLHFQPSIFLISQNILSDRLRKRFLVIPSLFENIVYVPLTKENLPFKNKEQTKNFFLLLSDSQRRILRLLVRGTNKIPANIKSDQEYLEKLNITNKHYDRWRLISPLLKKAALEITEGLKDWFNNIFRSIR